mgnify:FL=1
MAHELNRLSDLAAARRQLYELIANIDANVYWVVHPLVQQQETRPNVVKIHKQITSLNEKKAKIEEKILKIDIAIYEIAKEKLAKTI